MPRRIFPVNDWAPAQEAIFTSPEAYSTETFQPHHPNPSDQSSNRRIRSLSLSLPWRRPKSTLFTHDEMQAISQHANDLAIDDSRESAEHTHRPNHSHSQGHSGSIKGLFRRASVSLKGIVHRRASTAAEDTIHESPSNLRPTTAHSTLDRIRHATGFRHSRSFYEFDTAYESRNSTQRPANSVHLAIPGLGGEPPVIPFHTGAAAKASAAISNEFLARQNLQNRWLQPSKSEDGNDRESGIGITVTVPDLGIEIGDGNLVVNQDARISRIDFVSQLPTELAVHVLEYLDAATLAKVCLVSHTWNKIAATQHIWRESCLRETSVTYATSTPIQPGSGLGTPRVLPNQDWRQIYRIKQELIQRWKTGGARPVYLHGHTDSIYCLQFDEHKIITGSRDKTIRIWDMHTLKCRLIIGPPEVVHSGDMLLDEEGNPMHYASGSDDQKAASSMPTPVSFPEHHKASILCLQYDQDILVTGSSDSTCIVYDIKNGYQPIRRLRHHTAAVLDLVFDEKHIVTCSKDVSICVWDRKTGALLRQLRGHTGPVNAVQMRGNTIVSCSGDFLVKLWNIDTGKIIREFAGHTKGLACSQFSEDGRYVASAGNDKVIRIWDANTGECVREMRAHENLVRSLHIDSVSGRLVSGSYDRDIKVWDMETGYQLLDFPRWHASWVLSAKSDYRRIVSTGQEPKILIMDFGAEVEGIEMLESPDPTSPQGLFR
ncbi:F-box/WD repeat-containing protein 1A [Paramyrothecium foliicola]|nr:F-box/WD repeat-containing protein 1A [Paramyrothecium foliicola]